jgi:hypothetical protein
MIGIPKLSSAFSELYGTNLSPPRLEKETLPLNFGAFQPVKLLIKCYLKDAK